jgi:hypothetical protein
MRAFDALARAYCMYAPASLQAGDCSAREARIVLGNRA